LPEGVEELVGHVSGDLIADAAIALRGLGVQKPFDGCSVDACGFESNE
jgi:hypothetical protein